MIEEEEPRFILFKFESKHKHLTLSENATKTEKIVHYLQNLPPEIEPISMRKLVLKEFNVSKFTFYRAINKLEGEIKGLDFKTILPFLEETGFVVFDPFPIEKVKFFPDVCLYVSNSMRKKYLQFGRFIAIDFTYNLIRERPYVREEMEEEKKRKSTKWITGIISGLDSARRICVYAIAFCHS